MTSLDEAAREHLRRRYADVFTPRAIERHVEEHVGLSQAAELLALVRMRRPDAQRILDVGCGFGSFVLLALEVGLTAVGIEPAEFELAWARRRLAERMPDRDPAEIYVAGDAGNLPFEAGSFDVVTLWNVLEHVPDAGAAVAEAARVLRPGGSLFVVAPNYAAFRREAHYHVPWSPLLPRAVAVRYLRALGRDPRFYVEEVRPCTMHGIARSIRHAGLAIRDPRDAKLANPETARRAAVRRLLRAADRLGLLGVVRFALRAQLQNPLAATISIEAVKPR